MWSAGAITGDVKLTAVSRVRATAAVEGAKGIGRAGLAAHPTAYAIPADHPRPPLGRFKLTAYSGPQLGQAQAITATGKAARPGRTVAVDPKVIPLGARVYIEGVGERIAEDVGGGIRGQHIDIYVPTLPQAKTFGVKRRVVSVVALPEDDG
jgi:3D (Asp-Asp-Asp) domain-containing protein